MAKGDREFELTGLLTDDCKGIDFTGATKHLWRVLRFMAGKELLVKFSIHRLKRSDKQNRYIHGVVVPTVRAWFKETTGEILTHDECYTWLRTGLLGEKPEIKEIMGAEVIIMTGKRFSQMNTKEFAEAIDKILQLMAEKGCVIPEPRQENFLTDHITDD